VIGIQFGRLIASSIDPALRVDRARFGTAGG
jgi:hypothetical protein